MIFPEAALGSTSGPYGFSASGLAVEAGQTPTGTDLSLRKKPLQRRQESSAPAECPRVGGAAVG
jgi:hypothetical protein